MFLSSDPFLARNPVTQTRGEIADLENPENHLDNSHSPLILH